MANRSKHRHQPYDLNNPLNWTVAKLKNEIEILCQIRYVVRLQRVNMLTWLVC